MQDIAFQKRLSSIMLDNKYDRFVKNRKTGKLDTNSLYKINHSNKLFKRREVRKNKDYAVSLVVDCSGSMGGEKIKLAALSARKLSWHLSKMGIPHNVVIFHAGVHELKSFSPAYDKQIEELILDELRDNRLFCYLDEDYINEVSGSQYHDIFFRTSVVSGERLRRMLGEARGCEDIRSLQKEYEDKYNVRVYGTDAPSYNSDAEALKISRELLLKQKGTKIMIHLSDGQPAPLYFDMESPVYEGYAQPDFNLRHEVSVTLASNIELYSIGIRSSAVERYYPKKRTRVVNEVENLYPAIVELLKKNIKRG